MPTSTAYYSQPYIVLLLSSLSPWIHPVCPRRTRKPAASAPPVTEIVVQGDAGRASVGGHDDASPESAAVRCR